jgi:hypothetical protein
LLVANGGEVSQDGVDEGGTALAEPAAAPVAEPRTTAPVIRGWWWLRARLNELGEPLKIEPDGGERPFPGAERSVGFTLFVGAELRRPGGDPTGLLHARRSRVIKFPHRYVL